MQVKDELRVLVEAEVARAIENFKKLGGEIDESEKKSQSLGEALDSLSKKSLIISGAFAGAGIAAVKFAGENEKLKLSLKNMLGSAEEASAVFEDWRRLGASPGLNVDEVFSLGKALVNMGNDTQYATGTIKMLGDVAAGTGASFGEVSSSFERARAVGNLTTRDLVQLQQKGIPIVKQLAKEMGVSEESVRRLAGEGKIGFSELERAFKSMTAPGGQFAGMMDELSGGVMEKFSTAADNAKQALAALGETLLPLAADLLDGASSVLHGITNMDEGTKRFVVGMGGVIAVSGPAIKAIRGINVAMATLAANPIILAGAGITAGIVALFAIINDTGAKIEQVHKDYDTAMKQIAKSNRDLVQNGSFDEVRSQIRGLTREMYDAAIETGNFAGATAAAEKLMRLNQALNRVMSQTSEETGRLRGQAKGLIDILETPINPAAVNSSWVDELINGFESEERKIKEAIEHLRSGSVDLQRYLELGNQAWADALTSQNSDAMLEVLKNINARTPAVQAEIERIQNEIAELGSGATLRPKVNIEPEINIKKRWQDWFGEIANIDPKAIGESGAKAAQLYIGEFERTMTAQSTIAQALDTQLDVATILRRRQSDVQNALTELFAIDPQQIDRPFSLAREEVKKLVDEYRRLGDEAKTLENNETVTKTLLDLSRAARNLGKDQYDLALATLAAADASEEEIEQAEELIKVLREVKKDADDSALSFEAFLSQKVAGGLIKLFPKLKEQAADAIGDISAKLAMISFDGLLNGLSAVGEAFAAGGSAAENFKQAMVEMYQQLLNQLPSLFLQAGLQLIAQGQWPMGLAFIAAAGSTAIVCGYVNGRVNRAREEAQPNAHGNVYEVGGIAAYAHGGSFTNRIVDTPTYFRHGGKLGVMGEAGPESIMPLRRMANGDLGVAAQGGSAKVTVNIINKSGASIKQEETENPDGSKRFDVIIEDAVNRHIASGKADRVMAGRYGSRPVGV